MKSRILFGALVGTIALASCTADEDLKSVGVSQESPIKFEVSMEGGNGTSSLTRAEVTDGFKLNFEAGDLMSLFHGITDPATVFSGYENAIYEGAAKDGAAFVFTTKAMVKEGGAIMVYPADTTFANDGTAAPVISMSAIQDAKTKTLMPYMSEIFDIAAYDGVRDENTAGYDKTYKIILKQVASTLNLTTVPSNTDKIDNLGVSPLKVSSVVLGAKVGANGAFNTQLSTKYTAATPNKNSEYPLWKNVSDVDFTGAIASETLTTTDITNNYNAVFTLLPSEVANLDAGSSVTIQTNYGKVTLSDASVKVWAKTPKTGVPTYDKTVAEGIKDVLDYTWVVNTTAGATFQNEKTGGLFKRSIKADMAKLDMNGLHIKDAAHLINALKVYDAIKADQKDAIEFLLDGDAYGVFTMTPDAAEAYEAHLDMASKAITFTPCTVTGEKCTAIKFTNIAETEVPAKLQLGGKAEIQFEGTWKYSNANKKFNNQIESLVILAGSTMNISSVVDATIAAAATTITNKGTVNVDGVTNLKTLNMVNLGKIIIPTGAELRVESIFTNDAESLDKFGLIENSGVLGVVNGSIGKVHNYGYIKQMVDGAKSYVTTNQTTSADFANAFDASTNKFGTIELFNAKDDNYSVSNTTNKGFIMITTTATTVTNAEIGAEANYVKIAGACAICNLTQQGRLLFVEAASSKEIVWTSINSTAFTGLIVKEGCKINIKKGNEVAATTAFLKGTLYVGGKFTCNDFVGYLGGDAIDNQNIIMY